MYQSNEHSILPPYDANFLENWSILRDCRAEDGYISLTNAVNSQCGALWNKKACNSLSWRVELNYRIHAESKTIADGMAFWYVPEKHAFRTGEIYGGSNDFAGLLVAMDTFQHIHGYRRRPSKEEDKSLILAVFNDREKHFDWYTANEGRNDKERLRRNRISNICGSKTTLIINYDHENENLTVTSRDFEGEVVCFTMRDLKLPRGWHFGITARTGDFNCNHDIVTMKTFVLNEEEPKNGISNGRPTNRVSALRSESYIDLR